MFFPPYPVRSALNVNCLILLLLVILASDKWVLTPNAQQSVWKLGFWTYPKETTTIKPSHEMEKSASVMVAWVSFKEKNMEKERKICRQWGIGANALTTAVRHHHSWCQSVASENLNKMRTDFQCEIPGPFPQGLCWSFPFWCQFRSFQEHMDHTLRGREAGSEPRGKPLNVTPFKRILKLYMKIPNTVLVN